MDPSSDEQQRLEAQEAEAEAEIQWFIVHNEKKRQQKEIAERELRESGPEIAEFEEMLASFETTHSLSELHLIIDLTPEEAENHPIREPARVACIPLVTKLNALKNETNIPSEKYDELNAKYRDIRRAVGTINKNKVDHIR